MSMIDGLSGEYTTFGRIQTLEEQALANGYELGNRVDFFGVLGTITKISDDPHTLMLNYPIEVTLDNKRCMYFTIDGKSLLEQTVVNQIKVIGKLRPKVKKWIWAVRVRTTTGDKWELNGPYSEDVANRVFIGLKQKIDASMTEEDA